jgi:hypothetical protein
LTLRAVSLELQIYMLRYYTQTEASIIQLLKTYMKTQARKNDVLHLEEEGATELASTTATRRRASTLTFASPIETL